MYPRGLSPASREIFLQQRESERGVNWAPPSTIGNHGSVECRDDASRGERIYADVRAVDQPGHADRGIVGRRMRRDLFLRPGTTGEDPASLHKILSAVRFVGFFELICLHTPHISGVRSLTN